MLSHGGELVELAPLGWSSVVSTWEPAPVLDGLVLVALVLYAWGVLRVRRRHPARPWPVARFAAFAAALGTVVVAVQSGIGAYDDVLFWVHMVQHLMLIMVAPVMLVLGRPVLLLLHAARNPVHRWVLALVRSRIVAVLTHPLVTAAAYAGTIAATHLTGFMQVVLENETVHELEHALYLAVGYLFFLSVIGSEPIRWRLSYPARLALVFVTMPVDTVVGLVLYNTGRPVFPGYVDRNRTWGPTPVGDVQAAGAVMWIGGDLIMLVVLLVVAGTFLFAPDGDRRGLGLLDAARAESLRLRTGVSLPAKVDDDEEALVAYNDYLARLGREHDRRG